MRLRGSDLAEWMAARVTAASARGIVVGLSGGIDSAVVARLAQMATGSRMTGVILPCHSDPQDEGDARLVAEHFGIATVRVDLEPSYDLLVREFRSALETLSATQSAAASGERDDLRARVPLANVKPRLRMTSLYFVANELNYLVAGTGNRSELTIGYFTKYGDGGADILPLGHLLKSEVLTLARELGIPERIIDKPPSAGLWMGQSDEHEMGFTYEELERYLAIGPDAVSPALALKIERLIRASDHKRRLPPTPETPLDR